MDRSEDGLGRRFSRLFAAAWRRIPLGARRGLLAHWRTNDPNVTRVATSPLIELTSLPIRREVGRRRRDDFFLAKVSAAGHRMRFWSIAVGLMPDGMVEVLVAHELAHIHVHALGKSDPAYATKTAVENAGGEEAEVAKLMLDWGGFDDDRLTRWLLSPDPRARELKRRFRAANRA